MGIEELSAAEREVMDIVWERGEVTAREARGALCREVARNTVRTLLERMEEKGWVTHREVGREIGEPVLHGCSVTPWIMARKRRPGAAL